MNTIKLKGELTWDAFVLKNTVVSSISSLQSGIYITQNSVEIGSTAQTCNPSSSSGSYGESSYGDGLYNYNLDSSYINSIFIDDNRIVMTYSSLAGNILCILEYNTSLQLWEIITYNTLNTKIQDNQKIELLKYDTDKILLIYKWTSSNNGRMTLIDTTDNEVTEINSFIFDYNEVDNFSSCMFNGKICLAYVDKVTTENCGKLKLLELTSSNLLQEVSGTSNYFDNGSTSLNQIKIINIDTERSIIAYVDNDNNFILKIIEKDNDDNFTINSKHTTGGTGNYQINQLTQISTNKLIITYYNTTLYYASIDLNDTVIKQNGDYDTELEIDYVSTHVANSTEDDVYWFVSVYNTTSTVYAQGFMLENQNIYMGQQDTLSANYTYPIVLINSNNIGFYVYQNTSDTYGYFRNLENIEATSYKSPRKYSWETNISEIVSNFEGNLQGGNLSSGIFAWKLKRKEEGSSLYTTIGSFTGGTNYYVDNLVKNNTSYTYLLFNLDMYGNESNGIVGTGEVSFDGWMISDETEYYKILMGWNGYETSQISTNKSFHQYDNLTEFPVFSFGNPNYRSGNIKCIPCEYNSTTNEYNVNLTILTNFKNFIDNGNIKYVRTQDNDIIKVITKNAQYKYLDQVAEQPMEITFDFCEVGVV